MNIFISGLDYAVTEQQLSNLAAQYGKVVSAKVIIDRETGRSKGFGFVEMDSDEEGQALINNLNQQTFQGKTLNVAVARPKTDDKFGGSGNGRFGGGNRGGHSGNFRGGYNDRNNDRY